MLIDLLVFHRGQVGDCGARYGAPLQGFNRRLSILGAG